ncbi:MAG: VOC family protein [Myxococcales bacterium]|nr:VOC family protein [Myxococcales bacterium]
MLRSWADPRSRVAANDVGGYAVLLNLVHVNINVSDLDRAIAFYERIGFHVMHRLEGEGSDTMGPATSRGAVMSLSDDPRASCKIELLKWTPSENEPPRERSPYQVGVSRVAIRTKNLLETVEELRSRGVEFLSEPHEIDVVGAKRYVLFRDPDGTLLELIEF